MTCCLFVSVVVGRRRSRKRSVIRFMTDESLRNDFPDLIEQMPVRGNWIETLGSEHHLRELVDVSQW